MPATDKIVGLIVGDQTTTIRERDVIVHHKSSGL